MATFAKQSSNISALNSALTSFSGLLDVSEDAISSLTKAEKQENAELYLDNQKERVEIIDESLLKATEHILPVSPEAKTATELAELCRLVQENTRQKMGLLQTRLELLGVKTSWGDSITSPNVITTKDNAQIQWSVGAPLDCVIEGDVETEGATTPGSLMEPSPFNSATKRKTSLTPTTPTMNTFSFSSSTASILEKMNQPLPSSHSNRKSYSKMKSTPSPSGTGRSDRQLNFEGFQDDDDMISLNTTLEMQSASAKKKKQAIQNAQSSSSPMGKATEERSNFLARMESMLERVEEELIHENRPSDETSGMSRKSNSVGQKGERPSNSKFLEELTQEEEETSAAGGEQYDEDDDDDEDDDSTNMIATLVAEKPEPLSKNVMRPVPVFRRPTQIVVDTTAGVPSPSNTNITMDATMMNDTMASTSMMPDDDNDSTVTPILDRYRLDPDDNSIGIKVVPNRRGKHSKEMSAPAFIPEGKSVEYYRDQEGFLSPKGLPGSVSARKPKQFRKTPYPKKQLEWNFDDENHPNIRTTPFSPASRSSNTSFYASNPESSFSVPPLRPRSFGPAKTTVKYQTTQRTQSLPSRADTLPKTPSPRIISARAPSKSSRPPVLEKITMAEYNVAPRVVQMQVTRDEANQSIDQLEALLDSKQQSSQPLEFSATEGYHALSSLLDTEQKSKSVLMSLCHWRRLLMYREANNAMVFAVNTFER